MHLARMEREIDAVQDLDRPEALADVPQFQHRGRRHSFTHAALRPEERTQASTKRMPASPSASVG